MLLCLSFGSVVAQAQDIQTKGSISGTVADINGAVIQNARVTVTGEKTVNRIATHQREWGLRGGQPDSRQLSRPG